MRVDHNGRPSFKRPKPANPGGTSRLGGELQRMGLKGWVDPIEYAQQALRQEYAFRLAQYQRERGIA